MTVGITPYGYAIVLRHNNIASVAARNCKCCPSLAGQQAGTGARPKGINLADYVIPGGKWVAWDAWIKSLAHQHIGKSDPCRKDA